MSIVLLGVADVTSVARRETTETASLSDVYTMLVRERKTSLSDPSAKYNPFANGALFNVNTWRNGEVLETDRYGNTIAISAINEVSFSNSEEGKRTEITSRDSFGILKDWVVEDVLLKSDDTMVHQYRASALFAAQATGAITLTTSGSPVDIEVGDVICFQPYISPRYQVITVAGTGPTTSITLDRSLEAEVASGAILRVMSPVVKTGPRAIRDALIAAGVQRIGPSFDVLNASDTALNYLIRLFVRKESKVKLTDHLNKIMDMCDLNITVDSVTGYIDCFRGKQWDGRLLPTQLTGDEIILPYHMEFDKSSLLYGYDALYISGSQVSIKSGTVSQVLLDRYAASKRWQPVSAMSASPRDYEYLFANLTTAQAMGERKLAYNGVPRGKMTPALKPYPTGKPYQPFSISLGSKFRLTARLGGGRTLTKEPVMVTGYTLDKSKQHYTSVTLELINWLYPNLPRI